jgi:hypothetical protein
MQPSDKKLISLIRTQDAGAFETFFARYSTAIQRHIAGIIRDAVAAEDLVQEVFLRVWLNAEQWDGRGPVKAWLYRIATMRNGFRDGLQPEDFISLLPSTRTSLGSIWQRWEALGETKEEPHSVKSFHVLARARRVQHPGVVFAQAAATYEVDPLVDEESRLFIGLPGRSNHTRSPSLPI